MAKRAFAGGLPHRIEIYSALWDGLICQALDVCRTGLDAYYEAAMGRLNELVADYSPLLFAFNMTGHGRSSVKKDSMGRRHAISAGAI